MTGKVTTAHMGDFDVPALGTFEFRMCGNCGVVWGIPEKFMELRRIDGKIHFCPNGHEWHYGGETEAQKLRRELETTRDRLSAERAAKDQARAHAADLKASLRTTKGVVTKMKKRVASGVCPVADCNRHFVDLERHMASKHADLVA